MEPRLPAIGQELSLPLNKIRDDCADPSVRRSETPRDAVCRVFEHPSEKNEKDIPAEEYIAEAIRDVL